MNQTLTQQTLLEQMHITEFDVAHRKEFIAFSAGDVADLVRLKPIIDTQIDAVVEAFYRHQTRIPEVAMLIGDADTLRRLKSAQRRYILDLFSGVYDLEYVNNRLRVGLVHKRLGVGPMMYLAATHELKTQIKQVLQAHAPDPSWVEPGIQALDKLLLFDITLIFETYVRSLVIEIESARKKSEQYAQSLEHLVLERTRQLEEISRTDPLTGLFSRRYLIEDLTTELRRALRRGETLSLIYFDVDDFKLINDRFGHARGDEVLKKVGAILKRITRAEDHCFRIGGDEFCVILPACPIEEVQTRFCVRLQEELVRDMPDVKLSVGVAAAIPGETGESDDAEKLIARADAHMYQVKQRTKAARQEAAAPAALRP